MKRLSKLLSILLLSVSISTIGVNTNVKAAPLDKDTKNVNVNTLSNENLNDILIHRGTPVSVLSTMDVSLKRSIVSKGGTFESSKTMEKTIKNETTKTENGVQALATIPESKLNLTISSFRIDDYNISVTASYRWAGFIELPLWRGNDPFGIAYDSNKYSLVSSEHMDMYTYGAFETLGTQTHEYRAANAAPGNIYWNADLKVSTFNYDVNNLWGWGLITLRSENANQSCDAYLQYSHITGPGTFGLSFKVLGFTFDGSARHDDACVWATIPDPNPDDF